MLPLLGRRRGARVVWWWPARTGPRTGSASLLPTIAQTGTAGKNSALAPGAASRNQPARACVKTNEYGRDGLRPAARWATPRCAMGYAPLRDQSRRYTSKVVESGTRPAVFRPFPHREGAGGQARAILDEAGAKGYSRTYERPRARKEISMTR